MNRHDLAVYHDGSCPLCRLEIDQYKINSELIGSNSWMWPRSTGIPLLTCRSSAIGRFHVRKRSGELRSGAAAFVEIWKVLPRWRPRATFDARWHCSAIQVTEGELLPIWLHCTTIPLAVVTSYKTSLAAEAAFGPLASIAEIRVQDRACRQQTFEV